MSGAAACSCGSPERHLILYLICKPSQNGANLSNVPFVCCVIEATSAANVFIRLVLYSCIDDAGDLSLEMTHASKKLALDSHSDSNFVSLVFWSSLASERKQSGYCVIRFKSGNLSQVTYAFVRCKTSESRCSPAGSSGRPLACAH